jgi:hypothetical protein
LQQVWQSQILSGLSGLGSENARLFQNIERFLDFGWCENGEFVYRCNMRVIHDGIFGQFSSGSMWCDMIWYDVQGLKTTPFCFHDE